MRVMSMTDHCLAVFDVSAGLPWSWKATSLTGSSSSGGVVAGTILRPSLSSSSIGAKEEQPLLSVQEDDEEETAAERAESDDEKDGRYAGELSRVISIVDASWCQSDSRAEASHALLFACRGRSASRLASREAGQ